LLAAASAAGSKLGPNVLPLANILHRDVLRSLVDDRTFERGHDYFVQGRVSGLARHDASLVATVRGTATYRVRLWVKEEGLAYSCTCPMGVDGAFCKHGVAVGLSWLSHVDSRDRSPDDRSLVVVRTYLQQLDKKALVDLLLQEVGVNARLRELLERSAR
jgi:uncharacterized Zn finger protein